MENFTLLISNVEHSTSVMQNASAKHDAHNEENIELLFARSDVKQTLKSTKDLFIFSYSKIENKEALIEKFNLQDIESDSDLISKLFNIIGNEVFLMLRGPFSTIIYDRVNNCVYASSDHNNIYPIYYSMGKKGVTFVSDPRLLYIHKALKKELDEEILFDYLVSGLPRESRTIYKNVMHVSGSSFIHIFNNFKKIKIEKYFEFKSEYKTASYSTQQTKDIFLRTISSKLSMVGQNIATLLSGGLDSSSITSAIDYLNKHKKLNKRIHTFSAIFPELDPKQKNLADESKYIDSVLSKINCSSKKIPFNKNGPLKIFDELTDVCEPALSPNLYINFAILRELKKENIKFLFDGSGGDSVVGHGNARFRELGENFRIFSLLKEFNEFSRPRTSKVVSVYNLIKRFVLKPIIPISWQKIRLLSDKNRIDYFNLNLFLKDDMPFNSYERFNEIHGYFPYIDLPGKKNVYEYEEVSASSLFSKYGSRLSFHIGKRFGVEIITPFYEKDLMQYCLDIPMKEKMYQGYDRYYFRKSMRGIVSEKVLKRTDKGDLSPVFRNEFNKLTDDQIIKFIIGEKKSYLKKIIDKRKLMIFLKKYRQDPHQQNANILYKLVYLSQWLNKNFN